MSVLLENPDAVRIALSPLRRRMLAELREERQRRGFVERVFRTRPGGFVVDPAVVTDEFERIADEQSAEHLVPAAARTVRDVSRMQATATRSGKRLMTFTVETEVRFASPSDVQAYTDELAHELRVLAEKYDTSRGRRHRLVAFGHPGAAR